MWENILAGGKFLFDNSQAIGNLANIGSSAFGAYNSYKALGEVKKENDLGRESYYRNVLRQEKEDDAINRAAGSVAI